MALKDVLVMMLVLGGVLAGSLTFAGELLHNFGVNTADEQLNELSNLQGDIQNKSYDKVEKAESATSGVGSAIEENVFFLAPVWQGIKTVYEMIPFVGSVASKFGAMLGLPKWFINMISAIVAVTILFLIYRVFQ